MIAFCLLGCVSRGLGPVVLLLGFVVFQALGFFFEGFVLLLWLCLFLFVLCGLCCILVMLYALDLAAVCSLFSGFGLGLVLWVALVDFVECGASFLCVLSLFFLCIICGWVGLVLMWLLLCLLQLV